MPSPVPRGRFWAKLSEDRTAWHPLAMHSADVAAVLDRLLHPDSTISRRLAAAAGLPELRASDRAVLVYLAALHDLGKTSHGFQSKAGTGTEAGTWIRRGHVKVFLESLGYRPLQQLVREAIRPLGSDSAAALDLLAGVISHHGRPWWDLQPDALLGALWCFDPKTGRDPLAEMRRLLGLARRWAELDRYEGAEPLPITPAFTHLHAGALTLADWIGSTRAAFDFAPEADDSPEAYWEVARERAERACAQIGLVPRTRIVSLDGAALLQQLFPGIFSGDAATRPTGLQDRVSTMELPAPGSRLLIESETGSGKTEAALALYARLRGAGHVGGLMFALPTRATSRAMYERVREALAGMYDGGDSPILALAAGGAQPWAEGDAGAAHLAPDLTSEEREDRELAEWATSSAKKFFAAEVVVGTLDQVLLGGLPVRHAHLRLAALSRHLLIVDELHSYDRYMAVVLARVVDLFTSAGGVVVFMSATLSETERQRFSGRGDEVLPFGEAIGRAYPVLSICERAGTPWKDTRIAAESPSRAGAGKQIHWRRCLEDAALAEAQEAARSGARVCILRNTVREARATVEKIGDTGGGGLLWRAGEGSPTPAYHSRYTAPDRAALDEAVLRRFGRRGPDGGVILVATQVVEQSLDVDFDLLVTDLCPVDVLLQRIGRLHRHPERPRPAGFDRARALVLSPPAGLEDLTGRRSGPNGWGSVYEDLRDLELTYRVIGETAEIEIPRDNRWLIERVYHPEPREELRALSPRWAEYALKAEGRELGQEFQGVQAALDFRRTYSACAARFDDADNERRIRTRLGDDQIRVPLPHPVRCWYAHDAPPVLSFDFPDRLLREAGLPPQVEATDWEQDEAGTRFRVAKWTISYTARGWEWDGGRATVD